MTDDSTLRGRFQRSYQWNAKWFHRSRVDVSPNMRSSMIHSTSSDPMARHCAILYSVAVVVRVIYAFAAGFDKPLVTDELEFYEPARHLAAGQGYMMVPQQAEDGIARPTAFRVPGTALFLAIPLALTGPDIAVARWTSLLAASLSAPLIYLITRRLAPAGAAIVAGLCCAIYPTWVHFSTMVFSESVYIPLFLLAMLTTDNAATSSKKRVWLAAGILWGLAGLVRPHALPVCALVTSYYCLRLRSARTMLLLAGVLLVFVPWAIRNQIELGHPEFLATEGGETLLGSNNQVVLSDPKLRGMWISPLTVPEYREKLRPIRDEVERDREQNRLAIVFLKENTSAIPQLAVNKLWRALTPITETGGQVRMLVLGSYGSLIFFVAVGLLRGSIRRSNLLTLAILASVATLSIVAVYWGNLTKGRLPFEMIWLPWGAASAWDLFRSFCGRRAVAAAGPTPGEL